MKLAPPEDRAASLMWKQLFSLRNKLHMTESLLLTYIITFSLFCLSYSAPVSLLSSIIRAVSGLLTIVVVPGAFISSIFLPKEMTNLYATLILGLVVQILGIQFLYILMLLTGYGVHLVTAVLAVSSLVSIAGSSYIHMMNKSQIIKMAFQFDRSWQFIGLIIIAVAIRLVMLVAADGCLAPDASLYADFARNIQLGDFSTSTINDRAVTSLTENTDYIVHHAFTYIYAISWLLMEPSTSGPVFILILIGVLLILVVHSIVGRYFGATSALWISGIIAIHPLFVFHSAVGYGPEITSLLFLMFAGLLIFAAVEQKSRLLMIAGLFIGLVDVIWYANFLLACFALPAIYAYQIKSNGNSNLSPVTLLLLVALARIFYRNWIVFYGIWATIFVLLAILSRKKSDFDFRRDSALFVGIAIIMIVWRGPLQLHAINSGTAATLIQTVPLVEAAFSSAIIGTVPSFLFFYILHLSPGLLFLVILCVAHETLRKDSMIFLLVGIIASLGTLLVLSTVSGSLQIIYFYSDSRFFLLTVLMFILSTASLFRCISKDIDYPYVRKRNWRTFILKKRSSLLAIFIIVGLIPSYLLVPTGLSLINMEDRYGWEGLSSIVNPLGNVDTIFLANRVREFSWYTGRRCVFLEFSDEGLPNLNASLEMVRLALNFSAHYLLIDDYTIAKWKTLEFLLYSPISVGETIELNGTYIGEIESYPNVTIARLTLVGETESNSYGRISRVYSLDMLNPIDVPRAASERHFIKTQRCVLGRWEIEQAPATLSVTQHPSPTL